MTYVYPKCYLQEKTILCCFFSGNMTDCRNQGKYCKWSSDDLDNDLSLIYQNKFSVNAASKQFSIPRRAFVLASKQM